MTNSAKISVVIGTYNQADVLARVLDGYTHQTAHPNTFEVIVVDSGSTDGTHDLFKQFNPQFRFKGIIQDNQGKSGARNRGVNEAEGTYIVITDADMIPAPGFISAHLLAQEASKVPTCFEGITFNLTELHWPPNAEKVYPYIRAKYKSNAALGWYYFLTGNISFPKSLFIEENGFDREFTGYGWEDLELGYRLSRRKIPLRYLKSAVNYHYHVVSEVEEITRNVKKGESAKVMLKKHPELKWFLGLNPLSVFVYNQLTPESWIVKKCTQWLNHPRSLRQSFAIWFLKEYYYLTGILKD